MALTTEDQRAFDALELRIQTILPEEYQENYEEVQPVSMGSAGLKYGTDGKVTWDDMWETFCDLAMAGGPPHKGKLLEPGSKEEIEAQPNAYRVVTEEICRGITLVSELRAEQSPSPGWVRVECESSAMAGWMVRAIVMENVSARSYGTLLDLPAGPGYRLEKEIKNVITVIAKTGHYWLDHMWSAQQRVIGDVFKLSADWPLIQPALEGHDFHPVRHKALSEFLSMAIVESTGMTTVSSSYAGWLGVACPDVGAAIWMMRALVASNVLARREETVLFLPVNPNTDPTGEVVTRTFTQIHNFATARNVL